ncbi:hypothetical protein Xaut_4727 [Xanthobacter versatilis]|uniref:Uncharacterized protein n=1 Tax=Xanthobacter autotrophicus (strain ATCC BAA-1158 / Py2) TaxID=78245 RepID=A7IPK0_XANP2|nr:hypothetical protein Xaut_4727 [Xanthobacter autotrophicus Py2]
MTRSMRLSRLAYALSVAFLIGGSFVFAQFQDQLDPQSYANHVGMAIGVTYVIISSARLADAGFGFWLSFILITITLVALPTAAFIAYIHFVGPPLDQAALEVMTIALGRGAIVLWGAISLFCLAFPTATAAAGSGRGRDDDEILNWNPPGSGPIQGKQEPRF